MLHLEFFKTRKGAGLFIKGDGIAIDTYGEISDRLYTHYLQRGLLFVPERPSFVRDQTRYSHKVFSGSPDYETINDLDDSGGVVEQHARMIRDAPRHALLRLTYLGNSQSQPKFVEEWDFAHMPSQRVLANFLLYFNLLNKDPDARLRERDEFYAYATQQFMERVH